MYLAVDVWAVIKRIVLCGVVWGGLTFLAPFPVLGTTQSVTLAWNPATNADIAGYKIYYGSASHTYTNVTYVGNVTNATISGFTEGKTYYFAATSLNTSGLESAFSTELPYTIPIVTPAIQVTPASVALGTVLKGTSTTGSFAVKNTGGGTLSGTASVVSPFSIVSGGSYNLGSNQSQTVTVAFNPTSAGSYSQNVTLTGGGGATVGLSGSATNAPVPPVVDATPVIETTPASVALGTVLKGTSTTGSFTVKNTGGGTLSGTASVVSPFSIVSGGSYNLGSNQSQTVTVAFNPTSAGSYSQNVTLTGGGGATVEVSATATNAPVPPAIEATPISVALGTVLKGTSRTGSFTVKNMGGGTLSGTASVASPFSIVSGRSYNLSSNQSQTVTVAFNPPAAGSYSQNVTLTGGGGATVGVSASATNAPVIPVVSAISVDITDVDLNLAGLQVYSGTTVHFSATATNAQTWQWNYAVNGGSQVVYTNSRSPITNISFYFNTNTVGNSYEWTLVVSNGQARAESKTNFMVEALPNPGGTVTNLIEGPTIAATSGTLSRLLTSSTVIHGVPTSYWYQPLPSVGSTSGGIATYNVTITNAGDYEIQALVYAPNTSANSFLVNVDGQPQNPTMIWDIMPVTSGFEQRIVSWRGAAGSENNDAIVPKIFTLSAGPHQIVFGGREPGTVIASFTLLQVVTTTPSQSTTNSVNSGPSAPLVTSTPTNYVAVAGQTVTLNAAMTISSSSALAYQWQFNSVNLPLATNAPLELSNVTTNQSGTYSLMVSNAGGTGRSSPVTLTVYPTAAPTLTGATRLPGQFNMTVNGVPGYRYAVEASTNMTDWVPLQTNQAPFMFTDPDVGKFKQRFYRSFHVN